MAHVAVCHIRAVHDMVCYICPALMRCAMMIQVREQLQEALEEARAALRALQQREAEGAGRGSCMTASAAAGRMDLGDAESGDECESKPSEIHVRY